MEMDKVARLSDGERRDLFGEAAARRSMTPAIIEKDFWVCWVLKRLFADRDLGSKLVFKGGTSLSKVFGLIDRFSEDIDLVLDWQVLGFGPGQEDPFREFLSRTQQDRFNKLMNQRAAQHISETLVEELRCKVTASHPEVRVLVNPKDPHAVDVAYPAAFSEKYLRPKIRLEIGPLASWVPSARHAIKPYAADVFPKVFDDPVCPVVAIGAERTFWEKATILHQQAQRTGRMPPRYSRHYYDLYMMTENSVKAAALADLKLLEDVVAFKQRFYPCRWAKYEDAKPGSLKLIPGELHLSELAKDYREMQVMLFGEVPDFDEIVRTLSELEEEINGLSD
jgi:nucleotidyltransferase AbiEii toxin of type IV toxin-antitoxin system